MIALYRSLGRNAYRAAKLSGVPRTTLHRWLDQLGTDYGTVPATTDRVGTLPDRSGAGDSGDGATIAAEEPSSVLVALVKLDRVRHAYLDRLGDPEVVRRASARDASAVVKDAQAQIQLLTGRPTGRRRVRYVEPGALREMARAMHLERLTAIEPGQRNGSED